MLSPVYVRDEEADLILSRVERVEMAELCGIERKDRTPYGCCTLYKSPRSWNSLVSAKTGSTNTFQQTQTQHVEPRHLLVTLGTPIDLNYNHSRKSKASPELYPFLHSPQSSQLSADQPNQLHAPSKLMNLIVVRSSLKLIPKLSSSEAA